MFDKTCGRKSEDGFRYFEKRKIQRPVFQKASIACITHIACLSHLSVGLSHQESFFVGLSRLDPLAVFNFYKTETSHSTDNRHYPKQYMAQRIETCVSDLGVS